jgi:hypothetical protein
MKNVMQQHLQIFLITASSKEYSLFILGDLWDLWRKHDIIYSRFGAGGIGRLYINDGKVGEGEIPRTVRFRYSLDESFDIGRDAGSPVTDEYKAGAQFTGKIMKVIVNLAGEKHHDPEAGAKVAMKRQ